MFHRFPNSWLVTVTVDRGGGGLDRWGNPLPTEQFDVEDCLVAHSLSNEDDTYGAVTDTDGRLYHGSFVFDQNDIITVTDGLPVEGDWEVQAPSALWPHGTETRIRRVNQ